MDFETDNYEDEIKLPELATEPLNVKWSKNLRYKMFKAHLWVYEKSLLVQCAVMLIVEPVVGRLV